MGRGGGGGLEPGNSRPKVLGFTTAPFRSTSKSDRLIMALKRNETLFYFQFHVKCTPRNERLCLFCKANTNFSEIEDEQHVLLRCSRYTEIRRDLFDRVRKCCPRIDLLNDENKFMYMLNSSGSTIKDVARLFHLAYKARSA